MATRVYVELPGTMDVADWRRRHAQGLVPDETPYGLHRLADERTTVAFRKPLDGRLDEAARRGHGRLQGIELLPVLSHSRDQLRRSADVLLAMDERTGIPMAMHPGGAATVTGVAWLEDPDDFPRWYRGMARTALRRSDAVFTQCPAMAAPLIDGFGVDPRRLHVVRLGIDTDFFAHQPMPPASPPTVFSVGDDRMRDHPTLVAAVRRAREQLPLLRLELATRLPVDVTADMGVVHRRRMDEKVRACYARAIAVAVALKPTRQGSGLTVILEAMASGRPIIVTANPGLDRYVEHGVTGILVPQGDPEAMARAIIEVAADPQLAARMGAAARARAEAEFTTAHMAADLRRVIRKVLQRPPEQVKPS